MPTEPDPAPLAHICQECDAPTRQLLWKNPADRSASPVMICELCWYLNGTPVRDLMTAAGAGDAPAALLAYLADAYRIAAREVGPNYVTADMEVMTQLAANAWRLSRAKYGPRATWSRERGHHAATISTMIEDVTR